MLKVPNEACYEGYTLIVPSVAVGNVAQLSVDLLISNLDCQKIGSLWSEAFVPVAGLDPYDLNSQDLCSAVDLYEAKGQRILILQIRSTYVGRVDGFFGEVEKFVTQRGIARTIILTSSYGHERPTVHQPINIPRYLPSKNFPSSELEDLGWKNELKTQSPNQPEIGLNNQEEIEAETKEKVDGNIEEKTEGKIKTNIQEKFPRIPGGGFASSLLEYLNNRGYNCVVVFVFCFEGDNVPDAIEFLENLNSWLKILKENKEKKRKLKFPPSWKHLFGNPPPLEIY